MDRGEVKFFIDESLSPLLAIRLNDTGLHDAIHPLHVGRRGEPDHQVLARCLDEDRIIVTENARDFRRLLMTVELHPGLIVLPASDRETSWRLLSNAIGAITERGCPTDLLINHVAEVDVGGRVSIFPLPGA